MLNKLRMKFGNGDLIKRPEIVETPKMIYKTLVTEASPTMKPVKEIKRKKLFTACTAVSTSNSVMKTTVEERAKTLQ
jgi:hypothetical protein